MTEQINAPALSLDDLVKVVLVTTGSSAVDVHVVTKADAEEIRAFAAAKRVL